MTRNSNCIKSYFLPNSLPSKGLRVHVSVLCAPGRRAVGRDRADDVFTTRKTDRGRDRSLIGDQVEGGEGGELRGGGGAWAAETIADYSRPAELRGQQEFRA